MALAVALSTDLLERVKARAADPARRTGLAELHASMASPTQAGGIAVGVTNITSLLHGLLGGLMPAAQATHASPTTAALPAPLGPAAIADAEARLGGAIPDPLRQLYCEVADGGFGPGEGLLSLEAAVDAYRDRIANPPSVRGQAWPLHLLPITRFDQGHDCIDLASGRMVYWDEEELADGGSDEVWQRSFKKDEPSLAAWLERWLAQPSRADEILRSVTPQRSL